MFARITKKSLSSLLATALAAVFTVTPVQAADPITSNPSSIADIALGYNHITAVTTDGSVYAWGYNGSGKTGTGSTDEIVSEATKVEGLDNIKQVSASESHTLVLDRNGIVWGWGNNYNKELGRITVDPHVKTPIKINKLPPMKKVYAADQHSYGIDRKNNLWTWGLSSRNNGTGMLPRKVLDNVDSISVSEMFTMILKRDGSLLGYGYRMAGVFPPPSNVTGGNDWFIDINNPHRFDVTGVRKVAATRTHVAILKGGKVYEWGSVWPMAQPDPEDNHIGYVTEPTLVEGLNNVTDLYTNMLSTFAKKADNTLWAWGDVGHTPVVDYINSPLNRIFPPVQIFAGQNILKLATKYSHGIAVTPNKLMGWGGNDWSMLYFQNN